MSGGIMIKSDAMRKLSIVFFSALALSLCGATIAEAATAAPAVAKAAATAAAAKAVKTPAKTTTPPKQAVAAAKAPAKAVSYSLVSQKPKAKKKKPKKIVKIRKQVVDAKVAVWGRTAEAAEALAYEAARKLVGSKDDYLVKDSIFIYEAANRVICTLRINFTDEIPETWYLETEMVSGFGKTYERAYKQALDKAVGRAKIVQNSTDWSAAKSSAMNASELGVVPYDYVFASIGSEKYCKLFFRYMAPR